MKQPQSVTELPESPEQEHRRRVFQYSLAMGIRVVCVLACIWVRDWWLLIPAAGAIFLPYVAVVLANVSGRRSTRVERPSDRLVALEARSTPLLELPAGRPPVAEGEPRP
jgi:predicted tellurium resistance membrane protein TerC